VAIGRRPARVFGDDRVGVGHAVVVTEQVAPDHRVGVALVGVVGLPTCAAAPGLADWVRAALAPYTTVPDDEQFRVVPLVELLDDVPMLRDPPGAACVTAGRLGVGACWEVSTASGEWVARAVGAPFGSTRVPERMLARPDRNHQEWIGSGHGVNGWVDNDELEVLIRGRETLVVVAEVPGVAVSDYYSGRALLERLFLRDVVEPSGSDQFWLPTWLPDGVMLSTGRIHDSVAKARVDREAGRASGRPRCRASPVSTGHARSPSGRLAMPPSS
jgi:hypothetical protein